MRLIGALIILACFPLGFQIDDPEKAGLMAVLYFVGIYLLYFRKEKGAP